MTEQQFFDLACPTVQMPPDVYDRILRRVLRKVRQQRLIRRLRRVVILAAAAVLFAALTAHASPVPHSMAAVVVDAAGQRMADTAVDIRIASPAGSAATLTTTDADGEVWFVASPGDTVTVRAGSECHIARRLVLADNEPMLVAPGCAVWLPVVANNSVEGQEVMR